RANDAGQSENHESVVDRSEPLAFGRAAPVFDVRFGFRLSCREVQYADTGLPRLLCGCGDSNRQGVVRVAMREESILLFSVRLERDTLDVVPCLRRWTRTILVEFGFHLLRPFRECLAQARLVHTLALCQLGLQHADLCPVCRELSCALLRRTSVRPRVIQRLE